MNNKINTLISFLLLSTSAHSNSCPSYANAPICPEVNQAHILDETYPVMSYLISNLPAHTTNASNQVTKKFITSIINAQNDNSEYIPQIIVKEMSSSKFQELKEEIEKDLKSRKIPIERQQKILKQIVRLDLPNYTWQQDWFESFINPSSGTPILKNMPKYDRVPKIFLNTLNSITKSCESTIGTELTTSFLEGHQNYEYATLRNKDASFGSGEMGGNIEGLPGGLCLIGDNAGKKFRNDACNGEKNAVIVDTSFLNVGHVDELFKVIPISINDNRPKECQFSLMYASPTKAHELLSMNPNKKFLDNKIVGQPEEEFQYSRSSFEHIPSTAICSYINTQHENLIKKIPVSEKMKTVLNIIFFDNANANVFKSIEDFEDYDQYIEYLELQQEKCLKNITKISNSQMLEAFNSDSIHKISNDLISASIKKSKKIIKEKILERLPQCSKYFNELAAPTMFFGGNYYKSSYNPVAYELERPGNFQSYLPNPTNSVMANKTLIMPNSSNESINNYFTNELKNRGIKTDFIDTWDYGHLGQGNLHCITHSIPYCKGRK